MDDASLEEAILLALRRSPGSRPDALAEAVGLPRTNLVRQLKHPPPAATEPASCSRGHRRRSRPLRPHREWPKKTCRTQWRIPVALAPTKSPHSPPADRTPPDRRHRHDPRPGVVRFWAPPESRCPSPSQTRAWSQRAARGRAVLVLSQHGGCPNRFSADIGAQPEKPTQMRIGRRSRLSG
jgi:hypothetical protein